jgi:hypothetical protein
MADVPADIPTGPLPDTRHSDTFAFLLSLDAEFVNACLPQKY